MRSDDKIPGEMDETTVLLHDYAENANGHDETDVTNGQEQQHRRGQSLFSFLSPPIDRRSAMKKHHRRFSERVVESLSSLSQSISHDLGDISIDFSSTFQEELHEAHTGDLYFLEMGITRSLSVLPEDLPEFLEEATGIQVVPHFPETIPEEPEMDLVSVPEVQKKQPFSLTPYLSLFGAVMAVSSNGTALSLLHGVPPPLKVFWRMVSTAFVLGLLTLRPILTGASEWPKLTSAQMATFLLASSTFASQALVFVLALKYTSVGNVVMFTNSQAILLLMGKFFVGSPVVCLEAFGAFTAFTGSMLCSSDEAHEQHNDAAGENNSADGAIGALLGLLAALLGVVYLTAVKSLRPHIDVTVFMFLIMASGSVLVLLYMLVTSVPLSFDDDPIHGIFGWASWRADRLGIQLWIVLVCNLLGTMGFVRAMEYFDNLIIAVATLLEPMAASLIAYELKVGVLPGWMGWVGNLLVAVGTFGVVYPSITSGESGGH